jgi:FMN reductase
LSWPFAQDGIVIATPGYHGGVSGLVKNAIDLLEDLREDKRSYFDGRAVGLIVTAAGWQACGVTLMSMRGIVHAVRGWPTPHGITINTVAQRAIVNGQIADPGVIESIAIAGASCGRVRNGKTWRLPRDSCGKHAHG